VERKGAKYHQRVREGFLELVSTRHDFALVDASGDTQAVHERVIQTLQSHF
jgi:thymidylate kinase